jgi:hypothetical protein
MRGPWGNTGRPEALMEYNPKTKIGLLGEDTSDTDCIAALVTRLSKDRVALRGRGVGGGGNMFNVKKMTRFTKSLSDEGCSYLVVVHDLDRNRITSELNNETQLRARLEKALEHNPITGKTIIVPIEEIEAWLLSDKYPHPEKISNPKKILRNLDRNYRTSDNARIAGKINIDEITQKCPSFKPLQEFLKGIV